MISGRCTCGAVSYQLNAEPMIVHACHCSWCQGESGEPFMVNAVVETLALDLNGTFELVPMPTASGRGQEIVRCPECRTILWRHYPNAGRKLAFVRVAAMDAPEAYPPDVHIYTSTKQDSVVLPEGVPAFAEFYNAGELWSPETKQRWTAATGR